MLLSRAQHSMILLGNAATFQAAADLARRPARVWGGVLATLRQEGLVSPELQVWGVASIVCGALVRPFTKHALLIAWRLDGGWLPGSDSIQLTGIGNHSPQ